MTELVGLFGPKRWSAISQRFPGRIGKQCRERLVMRGPALCCLAFFRLAFPSTSSYALSSNSSTDVLDVRQPPMSAPLQSLLER